MPQLKTVITGSSFYAGAGNMIARLHGGEKLALRRCLPGDKGYRFDPNAIEVRMFGSILGHLPRGVAAEMAPKLDAGTVVTATKIRIVGAAITLEWPDDPPAPEEYPDLNDARSDFED